MTERDQLMDCQLCLAHLLFCYRLNIWNVWNFYLAPTSYFQDSYLASLSNCQIKHLLKAHGESIGGKKLDLIARLKKTVGSTSLEV